MKKKEKISLPELREIAVLSACIPQYKAMGFKVDSKITRLSAEVVSLVEYAIGDRLKELNEKIDNKTNSIRFPIIEGIDLEALNHEEKVSLSKKVSRALQSDEELTSLKNEEKELWSKEIDKEDLGVIEIEDREYGDKFTGPSKEINILYNQFTVDGYQALLALITKGYIEIK